MASELWEFFTNFVNLAWDTVTSFRYYSTGLTVGDFVIGFFVIKFIFLLLPSIFGGSSSDDD